VSRHRNFPVWAEPDLEFDEPVSQDMMSASTDSPGSNRSSSSTRSSGSPRSRRTGLLSRVKSSDMNTAKLHIIVYFFLAVSTIVTYKVIAKGLIDPALKQAHLTYETEKIRLEQEKLKGQTALELEKVKLQQANLQRYNNLSFYGTVGILGACGLSLIILATGHSRARVKQASVHIARIGQHSTIPIHHDDLQNFYPIAVNLSLAEIQASVSTAHESAYHISRQMIEDITDYTRAIAGKRGMLALNPGHEDLNQFHTPVMTATPTFAELLKNGIVAPGKPLVLGYDRQGQPQYRSLEDLKSVAIAGLQGSGKTLSTGYIVASSVLAYGVQVYVVDPHKNHPESLYTLIKPLENTGYVTIINPFDTPALITALNQMLDRRLAGQELSNPGILLVIDEMARLAKMECFDSLVAFLDRCTEETRKANMTFIGGSHKWTARYFKGRADIRGCMNSMLIHKTKPSQADLLLEDAHDRNLVKHLQRPGDAILATDYAAPTLVSMPFCRREDMKTVADIVQKTYQVAQPPEALMLTTVKADTTESLRDHADVQEQPYRAIPQKPEKPVRPLAQKITKAAKPAKRRKLSDVIPFEIHLKKRKAALQGASDPQHLTVEVILEYLQKRKAQDANFTQTELARQAGMSPGYLSQILNGQKPLSEKYKQKLSQVLFDETQAALTTY